MYVYLIAPTMLMLAVVLGWGPKRVPVRGFLWMVAIIFAMAIIEYFTGYFPAITIPFDLFMLLLVIMLRIVHLLLMRSFPLLMKNKILLYALIAVGVVLLLTVFSFGGILAIFFIFWPMLQRNKQRGPRSLNQLSGYEATMDQARKAIQKLGPLSLLLLGTGAALVSALVTASALTSLSAAATYGAQVSLVHATVTQTLPQIQLSDVPIVERDNAQLVLSNAIGTLGPQYHVSSRGLAMVRYHGQLIWAAPLDYNNGLIWLSKRATPGYVWTSASNPSAKPVLVLGQSYTITPQAGLSYNLGRVLYQHFPTYIIGTSDWELNPSGQGFWVTSLYKPAPGLAGLVTRVIVGSAITDPTTGHVTYYPLGRQPSWVSQIVGPNFAQNEALRYGWDRAGFFASTLTHQLATHPVHSTPYNVLLGNGGLGWEIPLTSPNPGDNSLSGLLLVDAETNKVTYTPFTGLQNDLSISQRIDGATINSTLQAGRALLYNVSGTLGYVAPVINQSGIVQEVAIVDPKNVAQPIIASNMSNAVDAWQSYLAGGGAGLSGGNGSVVTMTSITGRIERVATMLESSGANGAAVKEYWLYLLNGKSFRASLSLNPNTVPFVQRGDLVTLTYVKGRVSPITVNSIVDHSLQKK